MVYQQFGDSESGLDFMAFVRASEAKKLRKSYIFGFAFFGFILGLLASVITIWITYGILKYYGFGSEGLIPGSWADNRLKYGPIMYLDSWFVCKFSFIIKVSNYFKNRFENIPYNFREIY